MSIRACILHSWFSVTAVTCKNFILYLLHFTVPTCEIYIIILLFIISSSTLPGILRTNFFKLVLNDQLPVGLLAQLVRVLYQYHRGQSSNSGKPEFFQAFFLQLNKLRLQLQGSSLHLFLHSVVPSYESHNIVIIIISRILLMGGNPLEFWHLL